MSLTTTNRLAPWIPLWLIIAICGCTPREQISSYTVPRLDSPTSASDTAGEARRMLVALVPLESQAWFFKVLGPDKDVQQAADGFRKLVESIRVSDQRLDWDTPAEWNRKPPTNVMGIRREATIEIPTGGKSLELTVTALPMPEGDTPSYRLSNINRWRGQLSLPPIGEPAMKQMVEELELDGVKAVLLELTGTASATRRPPFASMGAGGPFGPSRPAASDAGPSRTAAGSGIRFETPKGWEEQPARGMRRAAFQIADGEQQAEVTVIVLSAAGADLLPNVNRWRGQLKLPPTTEAELAKAVEKIDIDDKPSQYLAIAGPDDADKARTILASIAIRGDQAWFFKLIGDSELADREQANFRSFLKSVRFAAP